MLQLKYIYCQIRSIYTTLADLCLQNTLFELLIIKHTTVSQLSDDFEYEFLTTPLPEYCRMFSLNVHISKT